MSTTPQVIFAVDLNINGFGYAGRAMEVKLPEINEKTEEFRGGGMAAPVDVAVGYEKLEATIKVAAFELPVQALRLLTEPDNNAFVTLTAKLHDGGTPRDVKALLHGRITKTEKPELAAGKMVEVTYTMNCTSYALSVDGVNHEAINIALGKVQFGPDDTWNDITSKLGLVGG